MHEKPGLPDDKMLSEIVDDLFTEAFESQAIVDTFTEGPLLTHHRIKLQYIISTIDAIADMLKHESNSASGVVYDSNVDDISTDRDS